MIKIKLLTAIVILFLAAPTAFGQSTTAGTARHGTVVIDHYPMRKFFRDLNKIEKVKPEDISLIRPGYYITHQDRFTLEKNVGYFIKGPKLSRRLQRAADGRVLNPPELAQLDDRTALYVYYEGALMPNGRPPAFTYDWIARIQMELRRPTQSRAKG